MVYIWSQAQNLVVESLTPLFCCVDGFIISRLYFLCHNFPKVSELNSKSLKAAGTAINSGDDLNDYTKPGRYYSPNALTTASLLNMPEIFESGFSMDVLPISSNNVQIIYPGGVGKNIYTRSAVSSGWQPWYKFAGTVISS